MLNESGSPIPFYIAKHDYESALNGAGLTLMVRKDCYDKRGFGSNNKYDYSSLDTWLCGTYFGLLDTNVQNAIGSTKFYYTPGRGNFMLSTLQKPVFQLSATELGRSASWANVEGEALPIASTLQIAYLNGSAVEQWTRSPYTADYDSTACTLKADGTIYARSVSNGCGSRPAFTLPGDLALAQNADGTYSIAA